MEMDRDAIKHFFTSDISEVIDAGMRAMDQDRTHYHSIEHAETMLQDLNDAVKDPGNYIYFQTLKREEMTQLLIAIAWHDVVYIPGGKFNERASAIKFEKYHKENNLPFDPEPITELIKSTEIGTSREYLLNNRVRALLHDLDYLSFSNKDRMINDRQKLRDEFYFLTDEEYALGRWYFLSKLAKKTYESGLYLTPIYVAYNVKTLINLASEIEYYRERSKPNYLL